MKVVFIQKSFDRGKIAEKNYGCSYMVFPSPDLSSHYLAAIAKKAGHETTPYEYKEAHDFKSNLPKADIYVIHSVYLSEKEDIEIASNINSGKVYFYGPAPTLHPERYLQRSSDFVLRGEIEQFFAEALCDPKKCNGVSYKSGIKLFHNISAGIIDDLDSLPLPLDSSLLPISRNPKLGFAKSAMILASRGCANQCTFCVPNSISWARELEWKKTHKHKPPVAQRSVPNIVKEIKQYIKRGINNFTFIDDQFIVNTDYAFELCHKLKKLDINYGILARCDKLIDPKIALALRGSGCRYVDLGVESFNQEILNDVKKNLEVKDIGISIANLLKVGIEPKLNIMFGTSPIENRQTVEYSINETLKLPVKYCMYSIATPYEGTEFYEAATRQGWILSERDIDPTRNSQIDLPNITGAELETLTALAYRRFYFRPRIVLSYFKTGLISYEAFAQMIKSIYRFFSNT